jgi:ubiquinol-cytochrome c reductase cytochrome c subunit
MPLAVPTAQPTRNPDRFNPQQTIAIAQYVGSLSTKGIQIPTVDLNTASVSNGFALYAENCAACHTITGAGDALSNGLSAPALRGLTPVQVTEAIETAPGNMPRFTPGALTPSQVNDVVAYVTEDIGHPSSPGGLALGGVGPVAEGFVGLFVGVGGCLLIAMWVGDRTESDDEDAEHEGGHSEVAHV